MNKASDEDLGYQKLAKCRKNNLLIYSGAIERDTEWLISESLLPLDEPIEEIDFLLNTEGGSPDIAYKITKILCKKAKKINILIPYWAKSAGTLICLCADELILSDFGELGPLDIQTVNNQDEGRSYESVLTGFAALEEIRQHNFKVFDAFVIGMLERAPQLKITKILDLAINYCGNTSAKLYDQIDLNLIGKHSRALKISMHYGKRIMKTNKSFKLGVAEGEQLVERLVRGYPDHGTVIDKDELNSLGLPVRTDPSEALSILNSMIPLMKSLLQNGKPYCSLIKWEPGKNEPTGKKDSKEKTN